MLPKTVGQQMYLQIPKEQALVLWFDELGIADISLVGGKNASLGKMLQQLSPLGINVPNGFATTAYAYRYFTFESRLGGEAAIAVLQSECRECQQLAIAWQAGSGLDP